ncbi:glycosyltransferase family 4 protein [Planctomicrobium sp. SH664]|uniref:glycosyltransferase family 4 protein n=1 Tax=Planctomicrobium sp. SH664 TaxID=3448125 RepID=UPI003F5B483E
MTPADTAPLAIGLLFEYGSLNGGEFSMLAVLDNLKALPLRVAAICPQNSPLASQLEQRGIPHRPCPALLQGNDPISLAELRQFVHDHQVQLLHANSLAMGRKLGRLAPALPCPTTSHLRDIVKLSQPALQSLQQHARLFAVSEATRQFHIQRGLPAKQAITIHNGIDIALWQPRERSGWLHRELQLDPQVKLAATIGQICLRKGQHDLARAAVLRGDSPPEWHLLLIGERHSTKPESIEFDAEIDTLFAAAGLSHRLHRCGFQNRIADILSEVDLLVHPARQEPFGRVLLEAAAMGTAIVATDVGGTPELLEHGESAWLVPAGDPEALATAITHALQNDELRQRLGEAARRRVSDNFPIQVAAERHWHAWQEVIRQRPLTNESTSA